MFLRVIVDHRLLLLQVKADVQQVGDELIVSGLESAMSLIQTARNLLNAVVLTVKSAYIASTKVCMHIILKKKEMNQLCAKLNFYKS